MEIYKFKKGDKCRVKNPDEVKNAIVHKTKTEEYIYGIPKSLIREKYLGKEFTIASRGYDKKTDDKSYRLAEEDPVLGFLWHQDMLEKVRKEKKR